MKSSAGVLSVVIFLVFSNAFVQSLRMDPDVGRLQLSSLLQHSVGKILSEFGHSAIAKRQTVYDITTQDVVDCISRTIEYQCGSSGYSQKVVDIATSCKNDSYARNTANTCARNEKGETCGAVTLKFLSDQINAESCLDAVANDACPSDCRDFLQSAKNNLGCCVNAYVNKTDYPLFEEYRKHVDYRLWNLCEVDLPDAECKDSGIKFDLTNDVKSCTSQEVVTNFVRYECSADVGQSLVNNLMKNDRCYIFSSIMVDACSSNGNGQYCAESVGTDLTTNFVTDPYIIALNSNCGARDPDSGCSQKCKDSITDIKNAYGCCVNVYNDSSIGLQLAALSYSVWNDCDIKSPGFCEATQTIPTKPPTLTTTESIQTASESIQTPTESIQTTSERIQTPSESIQTTSESIQTPDESIQATTDSLPITPARGPIASSEPNIVVIVATEISETTEHVITENMVSTNEEIETTQPSVPTEISETTEHVITENMVSTNEEIETTQPSVPTEISETTEHVITENMVSTNEEIETTQPSVPTEISETTEHVITENMVSTNEEIETTQPSVPTEISETTEHVITENMVSTNEEIETTQPSVPTVRTQSTPEEIQTTQPAESDPTIGEHAQTTAPITTMENTGSVSTSAPQTTQGSQTTEQNQPTSPTTSTEDTETIQSTEESQATDHHTQTEPTEPQSESTTSAQTVSESIPPTEATQSDHSSDHTQIFSLPTANSETTEFEGVVNTDQIIQTTKSETGTDHSAQGTESSAAPSRSPPRGAQALNDSASSTRALVSIVFSVVAVTLFIQQL